MVHSCVQTSAGARASCGGEQLLVRSAGRFVCVGSARCVHEACQRVLGIAMQVMVKPFVIRPAVQAQYYEVGIGKRLWPPAARDTETCQQGCTLLVKCLAEDLGQAASVPKQLTFNTRSLPRGTRNLAASATAGAIATGLCLSWFLGQHPTPNPAVCCLQMRKPLDVWSMIKSPYGLMFGFMLFGIFVFPMLKVDPEEYKEAMGQLRGATGQEQQPQQQRIRDR